MHGLPFRAAFGVLLATWFATFGGSPVLAEPTPAQQLLVIEDTDYQGHDFKVIKDAELDACKAACLAEPACRGFTYNSRARWCFLKDELRNPRTFKGAVSGRLLDDAETPAVLGARRRGELSFLSAEELAAAKRLDDEILRLAAEDSRPLPELTQAARAALGKDNGERAVALAAAATRLAPDSSAQWMTLSEALGGARPDDWQLRHQRQAQSGGAAIQAYLTARSHGERVAALTALSRSLGTRNHWLPAIRALRAALTLSDDPELRAEYRKIRDEHGFRITEHRVDADSATPRICIDFSEPLARMQANIADFVSVADDPRLSVEVEQRQVCIDGVVHAGRYRVQIREGLPAANGERLEKTVDLDIRVGDRTPAVRFTGRAYVLPRGGKAAIPVVSVNASLLAASVYRIGDRSIAQALREGPFLEQLEAWRAGQIARDSGERIFTGTLEVQANLNRDVTTAVPVGALVPELLPGVYALTAYPTRTLTRAADPACEDEACPGSATQWFVVSDLGLTSLTGSDGLHLLVRSLSSAAPLANVALELIARNNEVLARAESDARGYARFEPGLLRGSGGNAPLLVTARLADGDYGFLDLTRAPFDLSDRGVEGRPAPKPLDVFLTPERGVYRPGETVHLTALVRDSRARAVSDLPLTLIVKRPDGMERSRLLAEDAGQGGHQAELPLSPTAHRGTWRVFAHADPKAEALAQTAFLVEDFIPERIDFDLVTPAEALDPRAPPAAVGLDARFLYGAPAASLRVEGETLVRTAEGIAAFPGYRFGVAADQPEPALRPLPQAATDEAGKAVIAAELPDLIPTSRPLEATVRVRLVDPGGRPVERSLTLPVMDGQARVGLRPLFDEAAPEGGAAGFEVIALGPERARRSASVAWTLDRVEQTFQWYRDPDGRFDYEPVERTRRVSSGTLALGTDEPGRIEVPVDWGGYRLSLESAGVLPASLDFDAGWYSAPTAADTPDQLRLSLDKPAYRIGERARVRIEPRGGVPGLALVMVVDDRLIAMEAVDVPPEGASVELPVTEDWGPGAYVTAALYHPMDLDARRMPARALGLAWAGVDPEDRRLRVQIEAPQATRPRGPMTVALAVPNLPAGSEAYVTLTAVDLGILNVTGFEAPAPDAWYFGQRRLGSEIRDLYGALIDRMQGAHGLVRSGGDGGLTRTEAPPPSEELMAFYSGIVRLDAEGRARVEVPVVDFNGTLRLMAMAWSADGVGSAAADTLARDPVVVTAALPRFLAPGDRSRLLVTLTPVEGDGGEALLSLSAQHGLVTLDAAAAERRLSLTPGRRSEVSIPIEALAAGDETLSLNLSTGDATTLTRTLTLGVRANAPPMRTTRAETLPSGGDGLLLTADLVDGLVTGSGGLRVSVSRARLDVAGILHALDRFPYGCTEQITSRALPLLYLDETALAAGLSGDPAVTPRIGEAIDRILAHASAEGSFGLWGPGYGNLWLDAYVSDFLTRAREQGHPVPAAPFEAALTNLRNRTAYSAPGPADAYALYVLARNGRASIGDLRYLADERLEDLGTPMAKAQVGAALALYGDNARAERALTAAAVSLDGSEGDGSRSDFGSPLRDAAAVLALAAEAGSRGLDLQSLAERVQRGLEQRGHTSTQDQAWLLMAAHALAQGGSDLRLNLDGVVAEGAWYGSFDAPRLAASPVLIRNEGDAPVEALVTVTGVPRDAPPAGGNGYLIERAFYDLDGRRADLSGVPQGQRLVAILTVRADRRRAGRLIVDDPLPAGFEIDNPNLLRSAELKAIPGIDLLETSAHQEYRSDRFVAAVERDADDPAQFQLGYLVRAVSPGTFTHPPALVEDMYAPDLRAWTDGGSATVLGPVR